MSTTFEFSFIVTGVDPHSDDFEDKFFEAGCDDATLMLFKGSVVAAFTREDETYSDAVASAYSSLLTAGAKIERFDPDFLVTSRDIAERSNLSRQAITNYAKGERGEGFPAPIVRVMSSSPMWDWVDVSEWLYKNEHVAESVFDDALVSRGVNMYIERTSAMTDKESAFHQQIDHALAA